MKQYDIEKDIRYLQLLSQSFPDLAETFLQRAQRIRDGGAPTRYLLGLAAFY